MRSLRAHPNTLMSGQECKQLKGFGDKICQRIDQKLNEFQNKTQFNENQTNCDTNHIILLSDKSPHSLPKDKRLTDNQSLEITDFLKKKKKRPLKKTPNKTMSPLRKVPKTKSNKSNYIPSEGSGAYGILMALFRSEVVDSVDSLGKEELQSLAQEFTTTSMTVAMHGSHYSGWHSIKTLINKNLIEKSNQRNATYCLTEDGKNIASKLYQIYCEKERNTNTANEPILNCLSSGSADSSDSESIFPHESQPQTQSSQAVSMSSQFSTQSSSTSDLFSERFTLSANSFEIVLCIDTREQVSGVNREMRKTALMSLLQQNGVKVEMRTLSVGDFAWIAKQKVISGPSISTLSNRSRKELLLDFVIERKRIDDLASSLKDRRWDEQKYRLINCGVRKPSYIIEYFGTHTKKGEFGGIKCETLDQAIANAEVDGFSIKRCDSNEDTIRYLTLMTKYLESFFKDKTLYSCLREELINKSVPLNHFMTFSEFGRNANKITNFTVSEMFAKHLLQLRGISVSKAKVIIEHYPTLQSLLDAFSIVDQQKEKENLLSSLKCGLMGRNFGPTLSKKVYNHYNK